MALQKRTPQLSRALLELKFMKRSKLRVEAEKEAAESSTLFDKDITEGMKSGMGKFIIQESYGPLLELIPGRVSFNGMNPEVEKIMALQEQQDEKRGKMPADITDEQMAAVALTVAKKFRKHKRNSKYNFIKPDESD